MLSITECKKKLNKNMISYNDEEIEKLRNALYQIAEIMYNQKK
jgi:hypothetical protein